MLILLLTYKLNMIYSIKDQTTFVDAFLIQNFHVVNIPYTIIFGTYRYAFILGLLKEIVFVSTRTPVYFN